MLGMPDQIEAYLKALERDECYRVEAVLHEGGAETTEIVYYAGANGSETGPYIRKRFAADSGLGGAYERIWQAQRTGWRFRHLPRVEDCYLLDDARVAIVEYVRGETLAEAVYARDPSVTLARQVFPALCDAVAELHESFDSPLIHRDLKPSNVILSERNLTLIDFGIARTFDAETDADTHRFGTRAYAPPEQFGFGQTDVRSDVYALGMLLYYCLTERTPDAQARRDSWRAEGVPEPLRRVIEKAAAFDPAARYASARDLRRAFEEALAQLDGMALCRDGEYAAAAGRGKAAGPVGAPAAAAAHWLLTTGAPAAARSEALVGLPAGGAAGVSAAPAASFPAPDAASRVPLPDPLDASGRAAAQGGARSERSGGGPFSRSPFAVGAAWDALVALVLVLFLVACVQTGIEPEKGSELWLMPLPVRLGSCVALFFLVFLPVGFIVCDHRPLERIIKPLARIPRSWRIRAAVAIIVVGVFAIGLVGALFTP